jgi:TPR repeat protein
MLLAVLALLPASAFAGLTPEEVKAFQGIKVKAEKGDPKAQFYLGFCYVDGFGVAKDKVEAVKWYRKAAEQGGVDAQYKLGKVYRDGELVLRDDVEAMKWYRKAADQGHRTSQYELGLSYYNGIRGVEKDKIEAYAYWNLARGNSDYGEARRDFDYLEKHMSPEERLLGQKRSKELQKEIEAKSAAKKAGK